MPVSITATLFKDPLDCVGSADRQGFSILTLLLRLKGRGRKEKNQLPLQNWGFSLGPVACVLYRRRWHSHMVACVNAGADYLGGQNSLQPSCL